MHRPPSTKSLATLLPNQDSITFPGGNNRGSCIFAQTGVMTARSSRDGRRHTRFLRGNSEGFEVRRGGSGF